MSSIATLCNQSDKPFTTRIYTRLSDALREKGFSVSYPVYGVRLACQLAGSVFATMPAATLPQKRVLADSTKAHHNVNNTLPLPSAAKKRKLNIGSSPAKFRSDQKSFDNKLGSSQQKSQFEEEVLEKLTQDINGLKQKNSEKDQQWDRPSLDDFDDMNDNLCFQQIEAEEGTLHGGNTTIKLFGVTEASHSFCNCEAFIN